MSAIAMSVSTRNNHHQGGRKATSYCKVCHDAGLPRSEYTSHFVKDKKGPRGKVVCPLLLSQECRYCHEIGHTPKECPEILAKNVKRRNHEQLMRDNQRRPDVNGFSSTHAIRNRRHVGVSKPQGSGSTSGHKVICNAFDCLNDSDSESDDEKEENIRGPAVAVAVRPLLSGWAAIVAANPVVKVPIVQAPVITQHWEKVSVSIDNDDDVSVSSMSTLPEKKSANKMSWADMMEEDSSDEEYGW